MVTKAHRCLSHCALEVSTRLSLPNPCEPSHSHISSVGRTWSCTGRNISQQQEAYCPATCMLGGLLLILLQSVCQWFSELMTNSREISEKSSPTWLLERCCELRESSCRSFSEPSGNWATSVPLQGRKADGRAASSLPSVSHLAPGQRGRPLFPKHLFPFCLCFW